MLEQITCIIIDEELNSNTNIESRVREGCLFSPDLFTVSSDPILTKNVADTIRFYYLSYEYNDKNYTDGKENTGPPRYGCRRKRKK